MVLVCFMWSAMTFWYSYFIHKDSNLFAFAYRLFHEDFSPINGAFYIYVCMKLGISVICSMKNVEIGVFYQNVHGFTLLLFGQMNEFSRFMSYYPCVQTLFTQRQA